jgi:hypothetical protein
MAFPASLVRTEPQLGVIAGSHPEPILACGDRSGAILGCGRLKDVSGTNPGAIQNAGLSCWLMSEWLGDSRWRLAR